MKNLNRAGALITCAVALGAQAQAGTWKEEATLIASDGGQSEFFGQAAAVSGDTALIGAWGHVQPPPTPAKGAAYLFTRADGLWTEQAKLMASDGEFFDAFGWSIVLEEDTAAIGTPCHPAFPNVCFDRWQQTGRTGAVYIFTRGEDGWSEQARLAPSDIGPVDYFGISLALSGNTLVVGSPNADSNQGAAYVFTRADVPGSSWIEQARLTASDGAELDTFGRSVAVAGDTVLIGADGAGAAYVFVAGEGGWHQQTKLVPSDGAASFGEAVALSGTDILVGVPTADVDDTLMRGAVYAFVRKGSDWVERSKLLASDGAGHHGAWFGGRIALADGTAVIGAHRTDQGMGAAYVFTGGGGIWAERAKLTHELGGQTGSSVALSAGTIVLGAASTFVGDNPGQGAAHVFAGGVAQGSPTIDLDPESLSVSLDTGEIETRSLTIRNQGKGALAWLVQIEKSCRLPPWLTLAPGEGVVSVGDAQDVDVVFDATGLASGQYQAELCIGSNDPDRPLVPVPVVLTVGAAPDTIFIDRYEDKPLVKPPLP